MKNKKPFVVLGTLLLVIVIGLLAVGSALAQEATPTPETPTPKTSKGWFGWGKGFFGFRGGSWATYDAVAQVLNLTPTQLFEQLHSGKTLAEIAEAQGVDMQKVQDAVKAAQTQAMKDAISQAVKDGKITQAQADWLLEGLEQGYLPRGRGFGHGMRGGMRGLKGWGPAPTPTAPATGTSS
ncbi:MAG: hypothetical protein IT330_18450 [Anaerolineae bacterium]|nr:hypothetical protein [Anaerolineae bacterium]